LKDRDIRRPLFPFPDVGKGDPAWDAYMSSCSDYIKRQILIYQNWPQRRYNELGYLEEKVFTDMNA
jgi:hypothetical protein